MKTYTLTIPANTYKRLHALSLAHQHTPSEMLEIAINLLAVALPRANQMSPKLFMPRSRRSARAPNS